MPAGDYQPRDWARRPESLQVRAELDYEEMEAALYYVLRTRTDLDPSRLSKRTAAEVVRVAMRRAVSEFLIDAADAWKFDADDPDRRSATLKRRDDIRDLMDRAFGYPHTSSLPEGKVAA